MIFLAFSFEVFTRCIFFFFFFLSKITFYLCRSEMYSSNAGPKTAVQL